MSDQTIAIVRWMSALKGLQSFPLVFYFVAKGVTRLVHPAPKIPIPDQS